MARNIRPSWIDLSVDGRNSDIGTGPRRKDGGLNAQFYVREDGCIIDSVRVSTYSTGKENFLRVYDPSGKLIFEHKTVL